VSGDFDFPILGGIIFAKEIYPRFVENKVSAKHISCFVNPFLILSPHTHQSYNIHILWKTDILIRLLGGHFPLDSTAIW